MLDESNNKYLQLNKRETFVIYMDLTKMWYCASANWRVSLYDFGIWMHIKKTVKMGIYGKFDTSNASVSEENAYLFQSMSMVLLFV